MSGTFEIAGKTCDWECESEEVSCILLKLIFLAENALVPSILLLLYAVAALLCVFLIWELPIFVFFFLGSVPAAISTQGYIAFTLDLAKCIWAKNI